MRESVFGAQSQGISSVIPTVSLAALYKRGKEKRAYASFEEQITAKRHGVAV